MSEKLLEDARNIANEENRSLNDVIIEALERKVYSSCREPKVSYEFAPKTHNCGLPNPEIDLRDNSALLDAMDHLPKDGK